MAFGRWMALLGVMVGVGALTVAERTAVRLKAYDVGHRTVAIRKLENDTLHLRAEVMALQSPARLAKAMKDRKVALVARSPLPMTASALQLVQADAAE